MPDFSAYDLIIDARSPREFEIDHIPGARNLPVVGNEEYAQVGTTHRTDTHRAYLIGVAWSLRNMAQAIDEDICRLPRGTRVLVYCFRGGKRSKLWSDVLQTIGFKVDRLPGGWKAYRQWVNEELATLPATFDYRVLCGSTGCGKTRMLAALRAQGAQVLDLEGLAHHRGSLIGDLPGDPQPAQKWFDSLLLQTLRGFDPSRPVWLEAESKKIGALSLPENLFQAMHRGACIALEAPMAERVRLWRDDYPHFVADPAALIDRLQHLVPLVGRREFELWQEMARDRRTPELFERLMTHHYDPAYARSSTRHYPQLVDAPRIVASSLQPDALADIASRLLVRECGAGARQGAAAP